MAKRNYLKDFFKKLGTSKAVVSTVSFIGYTYVYLLYKSLKKKIQNPDVLENVLKNGPAIMMFWHGRSLIVGPYWRTKFKGKYDASAIFSTHRDGIFMEKIMTRFKIGAIRGSSNENSKAAAVAIYKAIKEGTSIALTIDGPTGPRQVIKSLSPFYFSSKMQIPILSFCWSAKKGKIHYKQWDRYLIPKPFSEITLNFSKPFTVKKDSTDEEINELALKMEKEMNEQLHAVDAIYGIPPISQQPRDLTKKNKVL
ncbi:MAG: DUF374 domain-containing protein [Rickettsiales bacterium]|jgi:lysophospholipid acyltransferase (LPLAT)-like uncharacterized protein|nr:DUF374 domain-containing protein [Rickettsiales bacterium]